jgi:tetratricopeptide (TPR) repeat protein/lysophospholipase L1-like esterase
MAKTKRNRAVNLLLLFLSIGVSLILAEAVLRLYEMRLKQAGMLIQSESVGMSSRTPFSPELETFHVPFDAPPERRLHQRSDNPRLGYELRPGAVINEVIHINSDGFRGREFSRRKKPGVYRIIVVGDSISFGWWERRRETWPAVLEDLLSRYAPEECRFEVYNMSVGGYNAAQEYELIQGRVPEFHPDLILLQYCVNDHRTGLDAGLWRHYTRTAWRTRDFLRLRLQEWRERLASENLMQRSYRRIAAFCAREKLPVAAVVFPERATPDASLEKTAGFIRSLGMPCLNLSGPLRACGFEETMADSLHPNAFGHRITAEEVCRFLGDLPETSFPGFGRTLPDFGGVRALFAEGLRRYLAGASLDTVLYWWQEAAAVDPCYGQLAAEALKHEALLARKIPDQVRAHELLNAALDVPPPCPAPILWEKGRQELMRAAPAAALELLGEALAAGAIAESEIQSLLPETAIAFYCENDLDAAFAALARARRHGMNPEYTAGLKRLLESGPDFEGAFSEDALESMLFAAEELAGRLTVSHTACDLLDILLQKHGTPEARHDCWRGIAVRNPDSFVVWRYLGRAALAYGRPDAAAAAFEACLERYPGETEALFALGRLRLDRDDTEGAAGYFSKLLEYDPAFRPHILHALHAAGRGELAKRFGE